MIHVQSARYFFGTDELIFSLPVTRCDMLHGALFPVVYCSFTVPLLYHFGGEIQKPIWSFMSSDCRKPLRP